MEVDYETLSHTRWECKYHIVFIPKYRRKVLYKELRKHLGEVFHDLARRRQCRIEEGHCHVDHVFKPSGFAGGLLVLQLRATGSTRTTTAHSPLAFTAGLGTIGSGG